MKRRITNYLRLKYLPININIHERRSQWRHEYTKRPKEPKYREAWMSSMTNLAWWPIPESKQSMFIVYTWRMCCRPVMLVLVLKDSLRTKMRSLSLTMQSLSLFLLPIAEVLVLLLVLEQKSLVMSLCSDLFKNQFTETACAWCKLACYLFTKLHT